MKKSEKTPELIAQAREALGTAEFFSRLTPQQRDQIIEKAGIIEIYEPGEVIIRAGDAADSLFVVIRGSVAIMVGEEDDMMEIASLGTAQTIGEMGVLLDEERTASVAAKEPTTILKFSREVFRKILLAIPEASLSMMRILAERLKKTSRPAAHRDFSGDAPIPALELLRLLPIAFMQRHRVVPVRREQNKLLLGYCDVVDQTLMNSVARLLPSMKIEPVAMEPEFFQKIMQSYGGDRAEITGEEEGTGTKHIDDLLHRLVEEGGSDLHLSAGQLPHWRIDGDIKPINGLGKVGREEVFDLLQPIMRSESVTKFLRENDEDFAYAMDSNSRFRVNLLRDHHGVSAVFRHIPNTIFSLDELGMPEVLRRFCDNPKGMVLVTGPTGSGKSTTLAAMIDHINKTRKCHILTVEDPIEFVHQSQKSLINQREIGVHTSSFARALRAALREDPDVVLVGEMRDPETISMALETANTGHLVLATLHTSTAASTIDRIVDQFPAESQSQVRSVLSENLIGVCCQTLCRKIGGGRVPALEILVMDYAMANMVREKKTHMLASAMITAQARGNRLLNDDLFRLVNQKKIRPEEALANSSDKRELEKRLGLKSS